MTPDTLTVLVQSLRQLRLLSVEQLDECARELEPRLTEPRDLARALVQRGWLTPYQVNELFLDRGDGLLLGSYVLLDKLGEGGMGTVYKARNWKLDKIVALKVIRKDRLLKPDTIKRFYREIRAVAQLDHPNIVRAFDADEVGDTHFFVMEYVEGRDLSQLVKKQGPLPIREACDYIRQAALGLQHAFECGLVHRDIKPHNLLLARGGRKPPESAESQGANAPRSPDTVKILDMGLALVESPTHEDDHSGTMTQSGIVMGTPDYMAPEQSRNAHDVDIRADLYSLGCTLYFLLVGRAPFGGGTLTQKLLRHQNDPPESIKKHRPDVPEEVEAVVHQLMAKRPEERYQTPRDLAQALEILQTRLLTSISPTTAPLPESAAPMPMPTPTQIGVREGWAEIAPAPAPGERPTVPLSRLMVPMLTVLAILLASTGGIWWATRPGEKREPVPDPIGKRPTPPRPKPNDKGKVIPDNGDILSNPGPVTDEWLQAVQALTVTQQYHVVLAKMTALNPGFIPNHPRNSWKIRDNKIVVLEFEQPVTDLSPLRALKHLETLVCLGRTNSNPPTPIVSVADLSPLKDLPLTKLTLNCNRIEDLTPLMGMKLTELQLQSTWVRDLTPLKDMHTLTLLHLHNTRVQSLEPLRGLRLDSLHFPNTAVTDLSPLEQMPLRHLNFSGCEVRDLSKLPLGALTSLDLACCPIEDLSPLSNAKRLTNLVLDGVPFRSLNPLKPLELTSLSLGYHPKHADLLRNMASLKTINNENVKAFWKVVDPDPEQERWLQETARLAPAELYKAVSARLKALNPDYKGEPEFKAEEDGVALVLPDEGPLTDLRFAAAIKSLSRLKVEGNDPQLRNLEPLRGLSLRVVHLGKSLVQDLSPLSGMPLERLIAESSLVRDLSPLKDTRLVSLQVGTHPGSAPVGGLAALSSLPLLALHAPNLMTRELSVLKSFKVLKRLWLPYNEPLHHEALLSLSLDNLYHQTPERFWNDIAGQQELFVRREMKRLNPGFVGTLDFVTKKDRIREITVRDDGDLDLTPLRALPDLQWVRVHPLSEEGKGQFSRLGPLKGLNLTQLTVHRAPQLKDIQPLKGMKLRGLDLHFTGVEDLTPIEGMPLNQLVISQTPVADISSLRGMKLTTCVMNHTLVQDVSPLHDMPLQNLFLSFNLYRDMEWMRKIKTLKNVNSQVADVFWKEIDAKQADFQKWCDGVAKMPAKEQAQAVADELMKRNPGFDGTFEFKSATGEKEVREFRFNSAMVKDLTPVRALVGLQDLYCPGPYATAASPLDNLWPLKGLPLKSLDCARTRVGDLRPLTGSKLTTLYLSGNQVSDLTPLKNLPLESLNFVYQPIHDLTPLKNMKLKALRLSGTKVVDLRPLAGMPLEILALAQTPVVDITPLKGMRLSTLSLPTGVTDMTPLRDMPITELEVDSRTADFASIATLKEVTMLRMEFIPWRDSATMRSLPKLERVRGRRKDIPRPELCAWADWEDAVRAAPPKQQIEMVRAKLLEVNGPGTDVTGVKNLLDKNAQAVTELHCYGDFKDISPIRALDRLQALYLGQGLQTGKKSILTDITPLRGLKVKRLSLCGSAVVNLEPLRGMELEWLELSGTSVEDLGPLQGMPLKELEAHTNKIRSLEPLRGMKLERLLVPFGKLTDLEPLRGMPLTHLNVSVNYDITDVSPLKGMKLTYLNLYATRVSDPTPLKGMPLEHFRPSGAMRDFSALPLSTLKHIDLSEHWGPKDWSPLEKAALESYIGPVKTWPALAFLRTQRKTLQTVNRKPAVDFWKVADAEQAAYDEWLKKTTALKPPEQIEAVVAELVKRNPGLIKEEIAKDWELSDDQSAVIAVNLRFNEIEDVSPLRALSRLEKLGCQMKSGFSKLNDLWPLQGLKLQSLGLGGSVVIDLRPLTGMPLKSLALTATPVADLTPLAGSSLTTLDLRNTLVTDLTPLKGSTVRDLDLRGAQVKDLSPLLEITVVNLDCDFVPERDAAILKKVKTLKTLNKKPVVEALKSAEARTE